MGACAESVWLLYCLSSVVKMAVMMPVVVMIVLTVSALVGAVVGSVVRRDPKYPF